MIRLSHSAKDKFLECPRKYELHYIEKIRPVYEGSPLFFGNALDEALNVLLLKKKKELTDEEKELVSQDIFSVFDEYFTRKKVAGEVIDLRTDIRANYYKSDFHEGFLTEEDYIELRAYMDKVGYEEKCPKTLRKTLLNAIQENGYTDLDMEDKSFLNYNTWLSMRRKGHEMIKVYEQELYPKIQEVISIQRRVEIGGDGAKITGLVDFEAILDDGKAYTVDNKTSSRKYKADSVETSPQLATYNYVTQHENAAYFVLLKKPKEIKVKECQKCGTITEGREKTCKEGGKDRCNGEFNETIRLEMKTQEVRGVINAELEDSTLQDYETVIESIETGDFPENRSGDCFSFGQKCQYYNYCREGKMDGLKDMNKEE